MESAQSLTRFLRSAAPPADVVRTARAVLDGSPDASLPHGHWFIFELVCERLNDTAKFKAWKAAPEVWDLVVAVWPRLTDPARRNKLLRRLRLVEVLTAVFAAATEKLLASVYAALTTVQTGFDLELDEFGATSLLVAFCAVVSPELDPELLSKWSLLVKALYDGPRSDPDYVPSKKTTERFFKLCVPGLANKLGESSLDDRIAATLTAIIDETAFTKHTASAINPNLELLLKSKSLTPQALELVFRLVVQKFGAKDVKICEDVFLSAVKSQNYFNVTESLMAVLSSLNKPLTSPFLANVYSEAVSAKPINWNLVGHTIDLDVGLTMDKAPEIVGLLNKDAESTQVIAIFTKLLNAFAKSRELVQFFTETWYNSIAQKPIWASPKLVEAASAIINELTSSQIVEIVNILSATESSSKYPVVLAILKGLPQRTRAIIDAVKEPLCQQQFLEAKESPWELKYILVTLYDDKAVPTEIQPKKFDKFHLFYTFRVTELTGSEIPKQTKASFLKHIKSSQDISLVAYLLERWPVLLNQFLVQEEIEQLMVSVVNDYTFEYLKSFLEGHCSVFLEQGKLVEELIKVISSKLNENTISLLPLIPVECYRRSHRVQLLNSLVKLKQNRAHLLAIQHLVSVPSFKSQLETEFDTLTAIFDVEDDLLDISRDIFSSIWTNHTKQTESQEFVDKSFSKAVSQISKLKATGKISTLPIIQAGTIMKSVEAKNNKKPIQELTQSFFNFASTVIQSQVKKTSADPEELQWALGILKDHILADGNSGPETRTLVKQIGGHFNCSDAGLTESLFEVTTICSDLDFKNCCYIIALYSVLYTKSESAALTSSLERFFVRLSQNVEMHSLVCEYVIHSFDKDIDGSSANVFMSLLSVMVKSLLKDDPSSTQKVIFSLSLVSMHLETITHNGLEALHSFLNVIKQALNTKTWVFNQYAIEQVMTLIQNVGLKLDKSVGNNNETIFICATQVVAHILLYHRYRLSSRHHLIVGTFTTLLRSLCLKGPVLNSLEHSSVASAAFSRVLTNLCEPPNASKLVAQQLTTASSLIKKSLKQYLPVLLVNYIVYSLRFNFSKTNNEELKSGIYSIFDVLTKDELESVNTLLDAPGKTFFKTVYTDYKQHGKWRDD